LYGLCLIGPMSQLWQGVQTSASPLRLRRDMPVHPA
jgi:hypothetical protein